MPFNSVSIILGFLVPFCVAGALAEDADMSQLSADELESAQAILNDLAADYENDPMATDAVFGIKIKDAF